MNIIHDKGSNLSDPDAKKLEDSAMKQEDAILQYFRSHPGRNFTAWEVYHAFEERFFIQSVRRAITNLEQAGELVKLEDTKRMGDGGVECNTWTINAGQADLFGPRRKSGYGRPV